MGETPAKPEGAARLEAWVGCLVLAARRPAAERQPAQGEAGQADSVLAGLLGAQLAAMEEG